MADFDSPWKEALDLYFRPFLALFFPHIHADIDWARGDQALDKEFQQLVPGAEVGRRYVDKLFKVWRRDGSEQWVLIHVEVQTTRDPDFGRRMFVYNYRVLDRHGHEVVSLAVLADDDPNWRPGGFRSGLWGCERRLDFPNVKLLDYAGREAELEASDNPFAKVLLAHLKALETRADSATRHAWKVRLVRGLYERGLSADDVRELFRLIDWLMELPPALGVLFWDEVKRIEEAKKMPFITTPERIGMEKGMEKGLKEGMEKGLEKGMEKGMEKGRLEGLEKGIEGMLEVKFGAAGLQLMPEVRQLENVGTLEAVLEAIKTAATPEEVRHTWSPTR